LRARCALLLAIVSFSGCRTGTAEPDPERMALLKRTHEQLHQRLETAFAAEPLYRSARADKAQLVVAIRSDLIEELAGNIAQRYLDHVTVDLTDLEAHSEGELRKKTLLGRLKVGDWNVDVEVGDLVGNLRAGTPRVGLRGPDWIDIEIPVEIQETEGAATLHLSWDSAALANVVCKDFELTREIRGRVRFQRQSLKGALRLANTGETLTATPVFSDRRVPLELDLTPRSWGVVEAALRSQDSIGRCGILMNPDKGMGHLKALAARGIKVRLPQAIFRTVSLPAHLRKAVRVGNRMVDLSVSARSLRVEAATLWSSAAVEVGGKPGL
jgi:hypothetical protein